MAQEDGTLFCSGISELWSHFTLEVNRCSRVVL